MSLATKLASVDLPESPLTRKGPLAACHIYGTGTLADWEAVEALRLPPEGNWRYAQECVDRALGITKPIPSDRFRYHWNRKCFCWPADLRR